MIKYTTIRTDIAEPILPKPKGFARTMLHLNQVSKRMGQPWVLEVDGEHGPQLEKPEALLRIRRRLLRADPGFKIRIHPDSGPHYAIKKIEVKDPLEPANIWATDGIRIIYAATYEKFGEWIYDGGLYVPKPGMHGTRPPNAWDAMVRYTSSDQAHARVMTLLLWWQKQALLFGQTGGREGLPINGAIGMSSIFGPYGYTPLRRYSGDAHVTHGHVSATPAPFGLGGWI